MMDVFNPLATLFEGLLQHAHFVAVLLGVVISAGLTQMLKYPVRLYFHSRGEDPADPLTPERADELHSWVVRVIAIVIGSVAIFVMWPASEATLYRVVWAAAGGVASPAIYNGVTHFWPWLDVKATSYRVIKKADEESKDDGPQ